MEAIAFSQVPAIPRNNVSRVDLLMQVRDALKNLKKGEYVVLHGMSGSGKSSLAAEALHDEILIDYFQGRVIWLSCGHDTKDDENEILALQIELNAWICDEELVNDVKTATINTLRVNLQRRFLTSDFKDGLVVLDDVNSPKVIEALKISCKTLVTTIDKDVMKKQGCRCKEIEVSESFMEEETMEYLSKCVGCTVNELPAQAALIHKHGKGHPLIMSLIGAQLEDDLEESKRRPDNWQAWLDVLRKREYGDLNRRSYSEEPFLPKTIEICINNLTPGLRKKYQDFALFVEDVNIKTEVLGILWDLPNKKVKKIMNELYTKSLIVRKYNEAENSYVYGIHDILRYYLRQQLDEESLKNLHLKLINRYKDMCNGDLSQLPKNDNYFFYYIGYHIANSKEYTMFQEWYFNLEFIEAKLKVAGPGDLLLDYKRYGSHFIDGFFESSALSKRLSDFVRFVEAAGLDVRRNNGPDIIQLALQEPHDSDVYKTALRIAQTRPQNTYLRFQLGPSKSKAAPHTVQTKEKVSAACFSSNDTDFIVAFESGTIQIVNQRGHKVREYEGHSTRVTRLDVSSKKKIFLSVSDSCVKIWHLPDLDFGVLTGDSGDRSPSPSQRQDNFAVLFNHMSPDKRKSWFNIPYKGVVQWASFSHDGSKFAVCCKGENKVEVYRITNQEEKEKTQQPWICFDRCRVLEPSSCVFSVDDRIILIGSFSSGLFFHKIEVGLKFRKTISYPILALLALPEIKFGVLTRSNLSVWDLDNMEQTKEKNIISPLFEGIPCLKDYNKGECELYTCCAAAVDGSVVAVATSNSKILICDPTDGSVIREIHESTGNIKYLEMDETKDRRLLACYDDCTVRVWRLGEVHTHRPATMRSNFVVAWKPDGKPILVAPTLKCCVKKVTDWKYSEDLAVPTNGEINICGISSCGRYMVISTPAGQVFLHKEGCMQPMRKILVVKIDDFITKLSVEKIGEIIYVVVGLKRSLKVWTCKEESGLDDKDDFCYKELEMFDYPLFDLLVDCFILSSEELVSVSKMGKIMKRSLTRKESVAVWPGRLNNVKICGADLSSNNMLVTLDADRKSVNFYDLGEAKFKEQMFKFEESTPTCCSFSFDGKKLAVGFLNGSIQLWDTACHSPFLEYNQVSTGEPIQCVCVSRTGIVGASTLSRVVLVPVVGSVGQARLRVSRLVMSPDDSTIITVDMDGHIHLIDQFNNSNYSSVVRLSRSFSNM